MYASVRQYTIKSGQEKVDEAAQEVQAGLGPIISKAPGFVAYNVLDAGNNVVAAISIFESKAAADTADEMVTDWIKQHLTSFVSSPPTVSWRCEASSGRSARPSESEQHT